MAASGRTGGIALLVGGRFGWLLLQIVALAVYVRVLGLEPYGVAILVALWRGYMKLLDLEIPSGALQRLSAEFAIGEARAWRLFRTTLTLQGVVAILGALLLVLGPWIFPIPPEARLFPTIEAMFAVAAFQHATDTLSSTLTIPFLARERFKQLAVFDSYLPMVFTVVMVAGVLLFRTPLALTVGTAAESLAGLLIKVVLYRRTEPRGVLVPGFDRGLAKDVLNVGWRVYLTNLSSKIGSTADRAIVSVVLGPAALTIYNSACRIPQVILEALTRLSEAITPNMTVTATAEPNAFPSLLRKNMLVVATVASAGIVAIGGIGQPIVQAWIKTPDKSAGIIVLLMALYYGLEQHFSTITRGSFARNKILWMIPFTVWNTAVTLLFTAPLAQAFGLGGVAAMNLGIDLVQIVPITYVAARVIAPGLSLRELLVRPASILGVGFGISLAFFALSRGTPLGIASFAWVPFAWMPGAITLAILLASGLGLMPDAVWKRLPDRLHRFRRVPLTETF